MTICRVLVINTKSGDVEHHALNLKADHRYEKEAKQWAPELEGKHVVDAHAEEVKHAHHPLDPMDLNHLREILIDRIQRVGEKLKIERKRVLSDEALPRLFDISTSDSVRELAHKEEEL